MKTIARAVITTLAVAVACVGEPSADEGNDEGADDDGYLPGACEFPFEDAGFGSLDRNNDGVFDAEDLDPGEAAVLAIVTDSSGVKTVWRQVTTTAEIWHGDGEGDLTRYGVWLPLVDPESMAQLYTTAVFEGPVEGITAPGSFTRASTNWDLAALERGGSNASTPGTVEISEVSGGLASGFVAEASGAMQIIDYLEQAPTGDFVCVQAMAFREIPLEP